MNYNELTDREKEVWDYVYEIGYDNGFDDGISAEVEDDTWEDGHSQGYREGVKAEQERIQFVLQMMFDSSINMGQGNKAVWYRQMMDLLAPVQVQEYSDDD